MSEQYKIVATEGRWNGERLVFDGFRLKGITGIVCPWVGGEMEGPVPFNNIDEEWAWAKAQIGKILECDRLCYRAFATFGKTRIVDTHLQDKP